MYTTTILQPLNVTARRLRVPYAWLRAEAEAGRVPCLRAGNRVLCSPDAVERVLAERASRSGQAAQQSNADGAISTASADEQSAPSNQTTTGRNP